MMTQRNFGTSNRLLGLKRIYFRLSEEVDDDEHWELHRSEASGIRIRKSRSTPDEPIVEAGIVTS